MEETKKLVLKCDNAIKSLEQTIRNSSRAAGGQDCTRQMLDFFVRAEIERRYFNIVSVELLCKAFGMTVESSMDVLIERDTKINLDRLIKNGRNLTVEQVLEAKHEFNTNRKERE